MFGTLTTCARCGKPAMCGVWFGFKDSKNYYPEGIELCKECMFNDPDINMEVIVRLTELDDYGNRVYQPFTYLGVDYISQYKRIGR